jgi:NADPH:quinone reductase-like Zn-dependent oxidoreductase
MFEEYDIKPAIGRVFEFEDAVKAFDVSMDRSTVGNMVIKV